MRYFVADRGKARGPYTPDELQALGITSSTMVWNSTMAEWTAARWVPELAAIIRTSERDGNAQRQLPAFSPGKAVCACLGLLPMGILAFVFNGGAQNAYRFGNYAVAYRKARLAHFFCKIGYTFFWVSLIVVLAYLAFITIVATVAYSFS